MLLSAIIFLICLTALITFWQPHGLFSALVTCLAGGLIVVTASFSHHDWAHGIALIGWAVVALVAISGTLTLGLILLHPQAVVRKQERLTLGIRLATWSWLLLSGGWVWAFATHHFTATPWPWLTFIPVFSLYLGFLYGASLIGFFRVSCWHVRHADTLVVLGAGLHQGSRIGRILATRLDTALAVARQQKGPVTILVSGGQGPDETVSEAHAMAAYLRQRGFTGQIVEEDQATNTLENLINSQRLWLQLPQQGGRVVLVTSDYHLFRTRIIAHQLGLRLPGQPAPTPWSRLPVAWAREFLAIIMLHARLHRSVALVCFSVNMLWWLI